MRLPKSADESLRSLGARFKKRRTLLNVTRPALASAAGISPGKLSKFEKTGIISTSDLVRLAMLTGNVGELNQVFNRKVKPPAGLFQRLKHFYGAARVRATSNLVPRALTLRAHAKKAKTQDSAQP